MPDPRRPRTLVESAEEAAAAMLRGTAPQHRAPDAAQAWRPTQRPPVALLTVCDDGSAGGEVVRLRADRFVIGRTEGDLTIPHDALMSARHAEVTRHRTAGGWEWAVTDLGSSNGLFVRLSRTLLTDGREFLAGGGRYRFDAPSPAAAGTLDHVAGEPPQGGATLAPGPGSGGAPPALTELVGGGIGNRVVLVRDEYWVGADPACAVCRPADPFCAPRQVRLFRTPKGWCAEHPRTANGLWVRLPRVVAGRVLHFQLGEQRFKLAV